MTGAIIISLIGMIALAGLFIFLFPENFAQILDRINTLADVIIDAYDSFVIKIFGTEEHRNTKAKIKEEGRQARNQEKLSQARLEEAQRQAKIRQEQAKAQEERRQAKLINCSDCGTSISRLAAACPKCGCPRKTKLEDDDHNPEFISIIKIIISIGFAATLLYGLMVIDEHRKRQRTIDFLKAISESLTDKPKQAVIKHNP